MGVQIGKSRASAHKQASPDGRFDVVEQHVDLMDLRRLRGQTGEHLRSRPYARVNQGPHEAASGWDLPGSPRFFPVSCCLHIAACGRRTRPKATASTVP